MSRVYLDWNATTPPHADALAAMQGVPWGNPSSIHADGRAARSVIEDARAAIGALTGTEARDVVFTSGGTESNNLALRSFSSIVTSHLEHPSVVRAAEAMGARFMRVLADGRIDLDDLEPLAPGMLVSVMAVNHETGVIQPVAEVIERAHARGAKVHVDATQAWGKIPVPRGADLYTVASHKMRGPKGIGALASRAGVKINPLILGGAQERGVRPGTTDAALAAGFGAAAKRALRTHLEGVGALRDRLEQALSALGGMPTATAPRAPHVTHVTFRGWAGAELVAALDLEGLSVSSGSACSAGTVEPSPVLVAMGHADPASAVRSSLGETTTPADIDAAIAAFTRVLSRSQRGDSR